MSIRYFTKKDLDRKRKNFYSFYKDEETGGLRGFNGLDEELTVQEVREIIDGLTMSYLNISESDYEKRTLNTIKDDVDYQFYEYFDTPPERKHFRKDLKRHYSITCENCLEKISSKSPEGYWTVQNFHKAIHGRKFCSEWCTNKYIEEIKQSTIKEKKKRYGL
ncbi:hypothetical protein P4T04_15545 [Bacillus badius]|uniref:hypothetical protein n=1 Tax=Bacillus badius TaxID=1455 RepID=UPI002E24E04D|nr:hypothetical protein [Bacillus badius]